MKEHILIIYGNLTNKEQNFAKSFWKSEVLFEKFFLSYDLVHKFSQVN